MSCNVLPNDHASWILSLKPLFQYRGIHAPSRPLKGDLLQEFHTAPEGIEGETGSKIIYVKPRIHSFLKIGHGNGHAIGQVLLTGGPCLSYVKTA